MLPMLNRCAVIARPKQPYLDWAREVYKDEPDAAEILEEIVSGERTVYLLPGYDVEEEAMEVVEQFFDLIFEQELADWCQDPDTWPRDRDFATFQAWFVLEISSLVMDTVEAPLVLE